MVMILKTDGGPHPPEKWADATSQIIFPLTNVAAERIVQARNVQTAILAELIGHHTRRQQAERANLNAYGDSYLDAENDASAEATAIYVAIRQIVKGTPWEAHFEQDDVREGVIRTIATHMQSINHIERQWHARRNPQSNVAVMWLAKHHP